MKPVYMGCSQCSVIIQGKDLKEVSREMYRHLLSHRGRDE